MKVRVILLAASALATTTCGPSGNARGRPQADSQVIPPAAVLDFSFLYSRNCAGCHGPNGDGGAAIGLADPVYLALADDATIRRITADGIHGTAMPAFAQQSGGMLTDDQINVLITGIRSRWAQADPLRGADLPPYRALSPGDPQRGASVYRSYCSSCHGANGNGGRASSIVDDSFLELVSDQDLRTTVIVGRPALGAPDWRNDVPGTPMSSEDVSDVVAWLSAQRPPVRGQPYSTALQVTGGIR